MDAALLSTALLSTAPIASAAVVAALLARSAVVRWTAERSSRAYELPTDYRPAVVRATAALLVFAAAVGYAVRLPYPGVRPRATSATPPSHRVAALRTPQVSRPTAHPAPPPAPHPAPAPDRTAPKPPRTVSRPAGGTLQELPDGTRVWLPPQYGRPGYPGDRAYPLVAAYLPAAGPEGGELYRAFAGSVARGMSDPLIVVQPRDCSTDPSAALDTAAHYYRAAQSRETRAVIGVGALAACAVRAELAHPERYRAAAGVSGFYDTAGVGVPAAGARPRLLLATAVDEVAQRASGLRLRAALRRGGVRARFLDEVTPDPALGGGAQLHLLAMVSGYLTEELHPHPYRPRHHRAHSRRQHHTSQPKRTPVQTRPSPEPQPSLQTNRSNPPKNRPNIRP